jgi:Amt family ammonium transporter
VVGILLQSLFAGQPPRLIRVVNGGVGGLVASTAGCAILTPGSAIVVGLVASGLVTVGNWILERNQLDDAVGGISVHAFCGSWGTMAVALFHPDGFRLDLLGIQALGCAVAMIGATGSSYLMFRGLKVLLRIRVGTVDEQRGLDYGEHQEVGYPEFQEVMMHPDVDTEPMGSQTSRDSQSVRN